MYEVEMSRLTVYCKSLKDARTLFDLYWDDDYPYGSHFSIKHNNNNNNRWIKIHRDDSVDIEDIKNRKLFDNSDYIRIKDKLTQSPLIWINQPSYEYYDMDYEDESADNYYEKIFDKPLKVFEVLTNNEFKTLYKEDV